MPNCSENVLKKMEKDIKQTGEVEQDALFILNKSLPLYVKRANESIDKAKKELKDQENELKKIKKEGKSRIKKNPEVKKHYEEAIEYAAWKVTEKKQELKEHRSHQKSNYERIKEFEKLTTSIRKRIKTLEKRIRLCKEKNKTRILKRCPNGTRKNKNTEKCESIVEKLIDDMLYEYGKDDTNQRIINEKYQQIMEKTTKKKVSKSVLELLVDTLEANYEKKYYGTDFNNKLENIIKHNKN